MHRMVLSSSFMNGFFLSFSPSFLSFKSLLTEHLPGCQHFADWCTDQSMIASLSLSWLKHESGLQVARLISSILHVIHQVKVSQGLTGTRKIGYHWSSISSPPAVRKVMPLAAWRNLYIQLRLGTWSCCGLPVPKKFWGTPQTGWLQWPRWVWGPPLVWRSGRWCLGLPLARWCWPWLSWSQQLWRHMVEMRRLVAGKVLKSGAPHSSRRLLTLAPVEQINKAFQNLWVMSVVQVLRMVLNPSLGHLWKWKWNLLYLL